MASKLMAAVHVSETSSKSRSRRHGANNHGVELTTSNDGIIYPNNRKSGSRIKSINGGTSVRQGTMYPLSSIETRVNAQGTHSSSEERIIGGNEDNRDPFNEDGKSGGINKTVEFEFHETSVEGS
jgi:hypothetical protein